MGQEICVQTLVVYNLLCLFKNKTVKLNKGFVIEL